MRSLNPGAFQDKHGFHKVLTPSIAEQVCKTSSDVRLSLPKKERNWLYRVSRQHNS